MQGRLFAIAAATLALACQALAEPVADKKGPPPPAPAQPTILAAVDPAAINAALKDQPAPPAKKRNARVTTCRCGDPAPQR